MPLITELLLPRTRTSSLSLDENFRAKEGGKEKTSFPWSLALRHQSLVFPAYLYAKPCEKGSA